VRVLRTNFKSADAEVKQISRQLGTSKTKLSHVSSEASFLKDAAKLRIGDAQVAEARLKESEDREARLASDIVRLKSAL